MADWAQVAAGYAQKYGVPADMFATQMSVESIGFAPDVISGARRSPAGAIGIAQIMPGTAQDWGVNPLDPYASLDAAARNMRRYFDTYGSWEKALWAYNAGPGAVNNYLPNETRTYLDKILGGSQGVSTMQGLPPPPQGPPQPGNPSYQGGDLSYGQIIQQYPDGTAMIYAGTDEYGQPKFQFVDVNDPAKEPRTLMNIDGLLVDPVTGRPVADYRSSTAPIGDLPAGYAPIRDTNGRIIQAVQDPSYISPMDRDVSARSWQDMSMRYDRNDRDYYEGVRRYDQDYGEGVRRYDQDFGESVRRYDQDFGLREADTTGFYNGAPTERRYEFDRTAEQRLYEFDSDLNERIATREQRITEMSMELSSLERRADQQAAIARQEISARLQIAQGQQATDMAIAQMDNQTRLSIADTEQETAYRGQDIQREMGLKGLGMDMWRSVAETTGRDPIRAAMMAYGDTGGTTPLEGAYSQMERLLSAPTSQFSPSPVGQQGYPTNRPGGMGYAAADARYGAQAGGAWLGPDGQPLGDRASGYEMADPRIRPMANGGQVVEADDGVVALVGEYRPEVAWLPPGSVVQPIDADRGDSIREMQDAAREAMPELMQRGRRAGMPGFATGGYVKARPTGPSLLQQAAAAGTPITNRASATSFVASQQPQIQPEGAPQVVQPVTPVAPPIVNWPAGMGGDPSTVAGVLERAFDPNQQMTPGQTWQAPLDPIFGQEIPLPAQMARTYRTRPQNFRTIMESAWGLRGITPEAAQEMMAAYTPAAIRAGMPVAYGYNGLTVRPIAA